MHIPVHIYKKALGGGMVGVYVVALLPYIAGADENYVTNDVFFSVQTGNNRGETISNGSAEASVDITTRVNGVLVEDTHEVVRGSTSTSKVQTTTTGNATVTTAYRIEVRDAEGPYVAPVEAKTPSSVEERGPKYVPDVVAEELLAVGTPTTTPGADREATTSSSTLSDTHAQSYRSLLTNIVQTYITRITHLFYDLFT